MLISWRPYDPVLVNYFPGGWEALCIKVLGSVWSAQAGLFSCLTKSTAMHPTAANISFMPDESFLQALPRVHLTVVVVDNPFSAVIIIRSILSGSLGVISLWIDL